MTRCVENFLQPDERSTPMSELRQELLEPGKRDIRRGLFLQIKICVWSTSSTLRGSLAWMVVLLVLDVVSAALFLTGAVSLHARSLLPV